MAAVTMDEAKAHLRVDGSDDDTIITLQLAAAEDATARYLNRSVPWKDAEGIEVPVPASVKAGILLLLGDLYANREAQTVERLEENRTVVFLLSPYRCLSFA